MPPYAKTETHCRAVRLHTAVGDIIPQDFTSSVTSWQLLLEEKPIAAFAPGKAGSAGWWQVLPFAHMKLEQLKNAVGLLWPTLFLLKICSQFVPNRQKISFFGLFFTANKIASVAWGHAVIRENKAPLNFRMNNTRWKFEKPPQSRLRRASSPIGAPRHHS